jgi:uncharacterized protein involved in cysteine biosynthesis
MDMKNIYTHRHTLKLIASHAILVAIVTQPAVISLLTDLYVIVTNKTSNGIGSLDEYMYASMQLLSSVALLIGVISLILYFTSKKQ